MAAPPSHRPQEVDRPQAPARGCCLGANRGTGLLSTVSSTCHVVQDLLSSCSLEEVNRESRRLVSKCYHCSAPEDFGWVPTTALQGSQVPAGPTTDLCRDTVGPCLLGTGSHRTSTESRGRIAPAHRATGPALWLEPPTNLLAKVPRVLPSCLVVFRMKGNCWGINGTTGAYHKMAPVMSFLSVGADSSRRIQGCQV